uniref:TnpV protein n=1 Tax=[Clostridium] polysaccharolyticum TaxID=29364 RepID=UPI0038CDB038
MDYIEKDGIQFADVKGELDEKYTAKLGKYGILAMNYWKENKAIQLQILVTKGIMMKTMHEIEDRANLMMDELQKKMLKQDPVKNQQNTMESYRHRQRIHDQAEEIVLREVVYK